MHTGAVLTTETKRESRTWQDILPTYSVILHNDDYHAMDYMVAALLKGVSSLTHESAIQIMLEAHDTGRAVVITCPLERTGLYRDRIATFGLSVRIEQA